MVMDSQHKVDNINDVQEKLNVYEDNDVLYSSVNTQIDDDSQIKDITLLNYDDYVIDEYGYKVYGHPDKWILDSSQQYENCGIVSALNTLSISNAERIYDWSEDLITSYALLNNLCIDEDGPVYVTVTRPDGTQYLKLDHINYSYKLTGNIDKDDGGTDETQVKQLLKEYGNVDSFIINDCSTEILASFIKSGHVAIVAVDAELAWDDEINLKTVANHFYTIIGVYYDEKDCLAGFIICDSGSNQIYRRTIEEFEKAWKVPSAYYDEDGNEILTSNTAIITTFNSKKWADDIDATGNDNNNEITGNRGNNILSGLGGDDILDGGKGSDTLIGGIGNDTYVFDDESEFNTDIVIESKDDDSTDISDTIDFRKVTKSLDVDLRKENANVFDEMDSDTTGIENVVGSQNNDNITGNDKNNVLVGFEGYDKILGGKGNDVLIAGDTSLSNDSLKNLQLIKPHIIKP